MSPSHAAAPASSSAACTSSTAPVASAVPAWVDRELYPFVPKRHATADGELSVVDEGRGPPILFVHGTPSWSFEWRAAIAALCSDHRCVAPDHLGFGLSDKPPANVGLTPADHARRLRRLVEALDLRDVTLVVHDFGGPIGLPLALRDDGRVRAVVIVNSWMWAHGGDRRIAWMSSLVRSWLGRLLYLRCNASPRWIVPAAFADRERLTPQIHRHVLAPFPDRASRIAPWVLGCELAGSDPFYGELWAQRGRLAELPTTLLWGMSDPAFGPAYLARWRTALPDARVVELPGVGHFPPEEAPAELVAAIRRAAR